MKPRTRSRQAWLVTVTALLTLFAPALGATEPASPADVTFVLLIAINNNKNERAVQPAWTARGGKITRLETKVHSLIPSVVYIDGRQDRATSVSQLARKVQVGCDAFEAKIVKGSSSHVEWATSKPLRNDFADPKERGEPLRAQVIDEATRLAKTGLAKVSRRAVAIKAEILGFYDLEKDGTSEIPVHVKVELGAPLSYEIIGAALQLEGVVWFRTHASGPIEVIYDGLQDWKRWPRGEVFGAVADFDGDGVAEVAMKASAGESGSSLVIYKLKNGHMESIFRTASIGGC